jgi:hypothetical protein
MTISSTQVGLTAMSAKTSPGELNIIHRRWTALVLAVGAAVGGALGSGS